jgi:signal transduction histidine kinase
MRVHQPGFFWGAAFLVAQTAMIAALLFQRGRRRNAEIELRRSHERISNLAGRLLRAQDVERARLARELHDDVSQQLAMLGIELHALMSGQGGRPLPDAVAAIAARAANIGKSVHELSHRLHPAQLRLVGLTGALAGLQRQLSTDKVAVALSHEAVPASLSEEVSVCLYRIAQEALNNAITHGRADEVAVHLRGVPGSLHMTIDDNGVGFDPRVASSGLGLISMTERAEQLGGSFRIRSEPGRGTHVEVSVPSAQEDAPATGGL